MLARGYEKEFDYCGLESFVEEELHKGTMPVVIVKQAQIFFPTTRAVIQQVISGYQEYQRQYNHCEKVGHKWVDESYGGPEHGAIAGYCKKCGYSFSNQLY